MDVKFKVGDKVRYFVYGDEDDGEDYVIEKEYYEKQVFLIGNEDCFCDMVPAIFLRLVEDKK